MTESDFNNYLSAAQALPTDWEVEAVHVLPLPRYDINRSLTVFTAAMCTRVTGPTGAGHTVVWSYHEEGGVGEFNVSCGDGFLDALADQATAESRCTECSPDDSEHMRDRMMASYNRYGSFQHGQCGFKMSFLRDKKLCIHTAGALAQLKTQYSDVASELKKQYQELLLEAINGPKAEPVGDLLSVHELAFKTPVLMVGDRGHGKTTAARQYRKKHNLEMVTCPGHASMESAEMLGHLTQYDGKYVWKDGPLSRAFRLAQSGTKVMLLIDEMLRIPARQQSILLYALSPDDEEGKYYLPTGRIVTLENDVGVEEVLEAPVGNLFVFATTNVGQEYLVEEMDPAVEERFVVLRQDMNLLELKAILSDAASKRGISQTVVPMMMKFMEQMTEALKQGMLRSKPSTRTLKRAVLLASEPTVAQVRRALRTQRLLWVNTDVAGVPSEAQMSSIDMMLDEAFGTTSTGA